MIDMKNIEADARADLESVSGFIESLYQTNFSEFFAESRELYARLGSKTRPITDEELSWILINLPMNLFYVSERLNDFRMKYETLKLRTKKKESELANEAKESGFTASQAKEYVNANTLDDKLLQSAYMSVIERVESEISFSKELIMGAKKIWDARRRTEQSNPVSEVTETADDLPEYKPSKPKDYIKGA